MKKKNAKLRDYIKHEIKRRKIQNDDNELLKDHLQDLGVKITDADLNPAPKTQPKPKKHEFTRSKEAFIETGERSAMTKVNMRELKRQ